MYEYIYIIYDIEFLKIIFDMGAKHCDLDSCSCLHQSQACAWTAWESESSGSSKTPHACTAATHGPGCSGCWEPPASPSPAQDKMSDKMPDAKCGTTLKPQTQVLQVSRLGVDRIPRSKERQHHLVQLHVGHAAANTGEVLHDEGHIVLHLGSMIKKKGGTGDRLTWSTLGWQNSSSLSWGRLHLIILLRCSSQCLAKQTESIPGIHGSS